MLRLIATAGWLFASVLAGSNQAPAQQYPERAIKFVVPFAPGSATDALARILAQKLGDAQGWTVVVENIAGASGMLAAQNVARASPDGHTVFITSNTTHAANQSLFKKLPYDPIADFEPVGKLGDITLALAVHPSVPANNTRELIAYGKANPGKLTFGSGSSSARLAGEMLKTLAGFDMLHVPYKSNPLAVADLLGGQISLVFADLSTTLPQIRGGKVKGFGVSSAERSPLAPELPTMIEEGVARLHADRMVCGFRAGQERRSGSRQAQCGVERRTHGQGSQGCAARCGDRARNQQSARIARLCSRGDPEMGRHRAGGRHPAGVDELGRAARG